MEVEAFLTHLAVNRNVSPSTQNVALAAILYLYTKILDVDLPWMDDVVRAKTRHRIPVVLNTQEISSLLGNCRCSQLLPISIMYGAGLRLMECMRLRVGDLDFSRQTIRVHAGVYFGSTYSRALQLQQTRGTLDIMVAGICILVLCRKR